MCIISINQWSPQARAARPARALHGRVGGALDPLNNNNNNNNSNNNNNGTDIINLVIIVIVI